MNRRESFTTRARPGRKEEQRGGLSIGLKVVHVILERVTTQTDQSVRLNVIGKVRWPFRLILYDWTGALGHYQRTWHTADTRVNRWKIDTVRIVYDWFCSPVKFSFLVNKICLDNRSKRFNGITRSFVVRVRIPGTVTPHRTTVKISTCDRYFFRTDLFCFHRPNETFLYGEISYFTN